MNTKAKTDSLELASAAVAELVAAGRRIQETRNGADADPNSVAMMLWDVACEQFDAALAKFGGAK
jgi:hypothetical protein